MSAEEVGERMSGRELAEWAAFEEEYGPILIHDRLDIGVATIAHAAASAGNLTKPGGAKLHPGDFLPPWLREIAQEQSIRAGFERLRMMAAEPAGGADAND